MAILSILALYNYYPELFDNLKIPTAADITDDADKVTDPFIPDKNILIKNICMKTVELEVVYSNPDVLKEFIGIWSEVHFPTWKALYNTLLYKYNPIWNKDGTYIETHSIDKKENQSYSGLQTENGSATSNTSENSTTTHNVTGFDTNSLQPSNSDVLSANIVGSGSNAKRTSDSNTKSGTQNETGNLIHRETGNIGVTTTQAMIEEQRKLAEFNLYETITEEFKEEFCIMLY